MAQEAGLYLEDIEQVRRRFSEWRSTHAVRSRLPEELWAAAVQLVQRDGIEATARALQIDKPSLRKWAERLLPNRERAGKQPRKQKAKGVPAFVELLASGSRMATSCLVEVESPKGAKLRLELTGLEPRELVELIRVFAAA